MDVSASLTLAALPSKLGIYNAWELRRQADGSSYRGRIEVFTGGRSQLSVSRVTGKTEANLGRFTLPFTLAAGEAVSVEFEVTGTSPVTISGRAWVAGATAPGWELTANDSSPSRIGAAGAVGSWQYASSGNSAAVTTSEDALRVMKDPGVANGAASTPPTGAQTGSAQTPPTPQNPGAVTPGSSTTTTTPQAPASEPAPAPSGTPPVNGRGSVPVGTASYPVPAGALFVDVRAGNDGASGSKSAPLRSLGAAIAKATAGATIVLRQGVYNESVTVPYNKPLTIQAYPNEAVWLDGSVPVTSWQRSGSTWVTRGWAPHFSSTLDGVSNNPRYVDSAHPMAARPDEVFIDGKQLAQVASASQVKPGTFFVDYGSKTISIGTDPSGHEVRASNLGQAINVLAPNTTLEGFGVRRYATNYDLRGTVSMQNVHAVARDLTIVDNATIGLTISNTAGTAERVTVERNGLLGIGVNRSYGLVIRDSLVVDNNSELFKPAPVAGGIKVTQSRGVTITNNDTSNNHGCGIWLDQSNYDINISNNVSNSNGKTGIQVELSDTGVVANNEATGPNQDIGILIFDSGNLKVDNNTLGNNRLFDVKLAQDERRQTNRNAIGHDGGRPDPDPTVPWLTRNITVSNNVFGNGGAFQFYALDGVTHIPVDAMNVTITGNLFNNRETRSDPTMVAWGAGDNNTLERYETPQALAAAKNRGWVNTITPRSMPLDQMGSLIAAAASKAAPLSSDVAKAIGQPVGARHVGRF